MGADTFAQEDMQSRSTRMEPLGMQTILSETSVISWIMLSTYVTTKCYSFP